MSSQILKLNVKDHCEALESEESEDSILSPSTIGTDRSHDPHTLNIGDKPYTFLLQSCDQNRNDQKNKNMVLLNLKRQSEVMP